MVQLLGGFWGSFVFGMILGFHLAPLRASSFVNIQDTELHIKDVL